MKTFIMLANGFEEIEALTPLDVLRRAGVDVYTVSVNSSTSLVGAHGIEIKADLLAELTDFSSCEMAIFPGGMPGAENLDESPYTDEIIKAVTENGGHLAAICAAPMIFGKRKLLDGKCACCFPGFENELKGADISLESVVTDGNITTSRGMGAALHFSLELVRILKGEEAARSILSAICTPFTNEYRSYDISAILEEDTQAPSPDNKLLSLVGELFESFKLDDLASSASRKEDDAKKISEKPVKGGEYVFPTLDLLRSTPSDAYSTCDEETQKTAEKIINTLAQFNVKASIKSVDIGPRITRYELIPAKGVRVNSVINLFDDIALNLATDGIRMEAPIPGRASIGIEVPRKNPETIFLRELLETEEFKNATSTTMACFGKDVMGNPVFGDIAKMPHMLIAGATGMGKSVCINALILSMLFRSHPDELKFIMIDTKMVEFNSYNGIPHMLIPVITDVKQAVGALMWAVEEMEKRYEMFLEYSVKNLDGYNAKLREMGEKPLSKIIMIIDELADLMLQARKPVEDLIMRITQKARAAGIHLIIGTQRPSVDIITGVIKANIPSRISFKVSSFQDSKTILEHSGADKLLNNGDMLFWPVGKPKPTRVQGAFASDKEVENVIEFLKKQNKGNSYDEKALSEINSAAQKYASAKGGSTDNYDDGGDEGYFADPQFIAALDVVISNGKAATSLLQRKLGIGYSRAAKYIDAMEEEGFISEPEGQKARDVLINRDELNEILERKHLK